MTESWSFPALLFLVISVTTGCAWQQQLAMDRLYGPAQTHTRLIATSSVQTVDYWRDKGFYPVLNERTQTKEANLAGSVMARMLLLKHDKPLPTEARLPDSFDFSLDRKQQCPAIEEFDGFIEDYPLWGMPYGLPALNEEEHRTLIRWLELGAPYTAPGPVSSHYDAAVA